MLVTFKGKVSEVRPEIINNWSEIQAEIFVKKQKLKLAKQKIINAILNNRKLVKQYLSQTDSELKEEFEKIQPAVIDYNSRGYGKTAFTVLKS